MQRILSARIALVGTCTALLIGCGSEQPQLAAPVAPALLQAVEARDLEERIVASGQLLARDEATVAAQLAGEITAVAVDEGEPVSAGQVVLEIDRERRTLELAGARARANEAATHVTELERELKRMRALEASSVSSARAREQAETALEAGLSQQTAAKANLGIAERALRDSSVVARFDGIVARRYVSAGEYVRPGEKLFDLVAMDPIEVEFHLPEADSARVRLGQRVHVRVSPYPEQRFAAEVSFVSPVIASETRTLHVKAKLANPDGRLRPGLFARVDLGIERREGVAMVPEEAVLHRADGSVMFRLGDEDRARRVIVETGVVRDGWIEIKSGVAVGDIVVVRGHSDLIDGSVVTARNADGSPHSVANSGSAAGNETTP